MHTTMWDGWYARSYLGSHPAAAVGARSSAAQTPRWPVSKRDTLDGEQPSAPATFSAMKEQGLQELQDQHGQPD